MNITREQVLSALTYEPKTLGQVREAMGTDSKDVGNMLRRLWRSRKIRIDFTKRPRLYSLEVSVMLMLLARVLPAATVMLEWDQSPDYDVTGYRIYTSPESGKYTNFIQVGSVTKAAVTNQWRTNFITVRAVNGDGMESEPSNEIKVEQPGGNIVRVTVQSSGDLSRWIDAASVELPADAPTGFYRIRIDVPPEVVASKTEPSTLKPASAIPVKAPFSGKRMIRRPSPPSPF